MLLIRMDRHLGGAVDTGLNTRLSHEQRHDEGQGGDQEAMRGISEDQRHRHPPGDGYGRMP